ncbi:Phosphatidylinositol-4-phosphate 5-kinase [Handroanthus impetiginosus]|uniref:1-phosphatidylinositol-3-phosphate 5-kinase n=1 Tax=Handroanthus impetiginosus TaxID=429701 RepID=A0A2G9HUQ3_9LAMI|nr:Phosphatidylinositol-4-phosphate 5-kinase [Handroanthus impetiginosus]
MDAWDKTVSDLVGLFKSWFPGRSEPAYVSRDFWMPDQSCRVCYECDSQFTLLNRRHHCRLCGRIFCVKCTSNWIPIPSTEPRTALEEWDKIRVCNYCFKQWQQGLTAPVENAIQVVHLDLSSTSATSFISTKSSGTCDSSNVTFVSLSQSAGLSPRQSAVMETTAERPSFAAATSNDHIVAIGENSQSQNQIGFFPNRSDDDDEEFGVSDLGSRTSLFSQVNGYFDHVEFDDINNDYGSLKVHPDRGAVDSNSMKNPSLQNGLDSQASGEVQQIVQEGVEHDITDEYEAPSSLCPTDDVDTEPMDFENNGVLWLPPEPEDEEDEREAFLFEDDDDGDAVGEWGYLRNSSSFGSGEYRSRDKSNEEHRRAMKNLVDGHFRALVAQLLQVENLSGEENEKESWLEIITALSWEAATLLKPDMSRGGQMDPGRYVKVKCLASGCRSESKVVKGVVCKKNVAHRRMTSKIEKPRLMILGGALEYQRVSNALSSFDTLLQQEMDHLKMAVAKIDAHHPNILLVEKSVSRYAQEYLLEKDISLVLNIKRPLLERIARCTGSEIVPSIDHLSSQKLGYCDMFHVEKYLEEHGTAGQAGKKLVKTLMYFEGCPRPLGCTILLHGANGDELKKVKHVVQYGVFAAYHLALETSFLADEGASLPELPLNSPITVALPDTASKIDRSISTLPGFSVPENERSPGPRSVSEPQRSNSEPAPDLIKAAVASIHQNENTETSDVPDHINSQHSKLRASSSVESFQCSTWNKPSPFIASAEKGHVDLTMSLDVKTSDAESLAATGDSHISKQRGDSNVKIMQSDCCTIDAKKSVSDPPSLPRTEEQGGQPSSKEEFPPSPSDHQSIVVSLSSRCVWKGTVCERSHLFRINYYSNFDKPLGRFLRDHLFDQNYGCHSCEMPAEAHVQCYTHWQGTLTISVKKLPEILLPGERDGKIWMWHRCLRCPRANGFPPATRRVVMSDAAWGLSFGKFLELSFSNHVAASRVASCGHSLHRDCLRFYGFGKMVACFRYASIDVHSVYLPPSKLDFNYESQEWIEREFNEVAGRAELLFSEVLNALRLLVERKAGLGLLDGGKRVAETRRHIADLEGMLQKEKSEFEEALQKILNNEVKKGQPTIDILELNRLRRQLVFQSYMWDHRLIYADSLYNKRPDELQVTCQGSIQKPVPVPEKLLDVNVSIETVKILDSSGPIASDAKADQSPERGINDWHNNHDEAPQKNDASFNSDPGNQNSLAVSTGTKATDESHMESDVTVHRVVSDCEAPICISDSRDAAWTGENYPCGGIAKNISFSESVEAGNLSTFGMPEKLDADNLSTVGASEKLDAANLSTAGVFEKVDVEEYGEDLSLSKASHSPSFLSSKSSDNLEDSLTWSGMSFVNFYRSLNRNFLGSAQKLDALSEYDPIYISSFREYELQGGARLLLPVGVNDTVVPVYDDEPTSIISYALVSSDYHIQLSDDPERLKDTGDYMFSMQSLDTDTGDYMFSMQSLDTVNFQSSHSLDEKKLESYRSVGSGDESISSLATGSSLPLDPLAYTKTLHARVSFAEDGPLGKVKYTVTCYYAKRFEALRRICCPSEVDFIRSLSRCKKWGAQGGKSNVFFAKTLDDRFIIKQVTKTELESFIKFAPGYFKYLSESISSGSPTCLAKILGIYQVTSKHFKGGKESKMDLLVMENLLFGRNLTRLYDLKGSLRARYNPDSSGGNKVLLDQNLIEAMPTFFFFWFFFFTFFYFKGGKESKMDLLVMENLLFGRNLTRLYDLKGSLRARYNPDSSGGNKVLLDQNLIEAMPTSPIFVGNKAKRLLERAVWNDTAFLASIDVMDYSLLVGVDKEKHELVLGIIDFMRKYTWDKHLETWVKASGILGGSNDPPTVISPKQYKKRFRKAMTTYFLMVPDQWSPPTIIPSKSQTDLCEENNAQSEENKTQTTTPSE